MLVDAIGRLNERPGNGPCDGLLSRATLKNMQKRETQLNKKADTIVVKAGYIKRDHQGVTAMKLSIVAAATLFALSGSAFAQNGSSGGLNGGTLGLSQPGANAGVPYPNPAAADPAPEATDDPTPAAPDRTAPVASSSMKPQGAATPKHRKDPATSASGKKPPAQSGASAQAAAKPAPPPSPGASSPR